MEALIGVGLFIVAAGLFYLFVVRKDGDHFPGSSSGDDGWEPEYPDDEDPRF